MRKRLLFSLYLAPITGLISYAFPKLLVALGVPLDQWIVTIAELLKIYISSNTALLATSLVLGLALYIPALWLLWRKPMHGDNTIYPPKITQRSQPRKTANTKIDNSANLKMALKMEEAKFWFEAASDKTLVKGACEIQIKNCLQIPLKDCLAYVEKIIEGNDVHDVQSALKASAKGFTLRQGETHNFQIATRDLKDVINNPPWVLKLVSKDFPLYSGREYILSILLHSEYQYATKVDLRLSIDEEKKVSVKILDQAADPTVKRKPPEVERTPLATARFVYSAEEDKYSLLVRENVEVTILPPSLFGKITSFMQSHDLVFSFNYYRGPFDVTIHPSIGEFEGCSRYNVSENMERFVKINAAHPLFKASKSHEVAFNFFQQE